VALIDADFQSAALTRQLGQPSALAWEEIVRQRNFQDAGQALDSQGRLSFFSQRVSSAGPNQLLTSSGLAAWLAWLRQEFAVIFLDGGSLLTGGTQWAPWVDAALVVCRSGPELSAEWARAWDRLEEAGTHVLGIIETFVQ
jgi:Mrp family chromosome partitioning ATPase